MLREQESHTDGSLGERASNLCQRRKAMFPGIKKGERGASQADFWFPVTAVNSQTNS